MRHYLADLWGLDLQVGLLMDKLRELDLDQKTIIIFTSDHGAAPVDPDAQSFPLRMMGLMGGLRGEKHTFYEGGVRVPYIVRYPGHVPAGKVNHLSIISGLDLLPTVATIAKVDYNPSLFEGEDMSDVWFGADRTRTNPLFWRFSRTDGHRAMLYGKWKLHISRRDKRALYDLEADREERNNLYETENVTRLGMEQRLQQWEDTLPKNYCRLDERYEPCKGGIPLAYDPTIPPVKLGPPMNVTYEVVSYESAAVLAPSSIIYTANPTQLGEGKKKPASFKICSAARVPTTSPMPTVQPVPTIAPANTSSDALELEDNKKEAVMIEEEGLEEKEEVEEGEEKEVVSTEEGEEKEVQVVVIEEEEEEQSEDEGNIANEKDIPANVTSAASSPFRSGRTRCIGAYLGWLLLVVIATTF